MNLNAATLTKIIDATTRINNMDVEDARSILLKLLASKPSVILGSLATEVACSTFKVVVTALNGEDRRINCIKVFREVSGFGLADSKAWTEGHTLKVYGTNEDLPSGTFRTGMTPSAALELCERVKQASLASGGLKWTVAVVPDTRIVKPFTYKTDYTHGRSEWSI
jgi:ribosomal protein L7/L12